MNGPRRLVRRGADQRRSTVQRNSRAPRSREGRATSPSHTDDTRGEHRKLDRAYRIGEFRNQPPAIAASAGIITGKVRYANITSCTLPSRATNQGWMALK